MNHHNNLKHCLIALALCAALAGAAVPASASSLGTATELEGKILIFSCFASTSDCPWDFSLSADSETRATALNCLTIATDWLTEQAAAWGKKVEFIYNWEEDASLATACDLGVPLTGSNAVTDESVWAMIDRVFPDEEQLIEQYGTANRLYMIFYNTPLTFTDTSATRAWYEGMPSESEFCSMYLHSFGTEEFPAAYAHEILHTFGAPDLYLSDDGTGWNYNITEAFIAYCEENLPNEIMLTVYDQDTGEIVRDAVTNELTALTAYYIGWTDASALQEEWQLLPSEHR